MPDPFPPADGHGFYAFRLSRLTDRRLPDFHALLDAQAQSHAAGSTMQHSNHGRHLFDAIVKDKRAEAFLVIGNRSNETMAAVTYYDCVTAAGKPALYLEDIITAPQARRTGAGKVAMAALAQIAEQKQVDSIVWECSLDNKPAQNFYDSLGCKREDDRHTWRLMGPVLQHNGASATHGFLAAADAITMPAARQTGARRSMVQANASGFYAPEQMGDHTATGNLQPCQGIAPLAQSSFQAQLPQANGNLLRINLREPQGDTVGQIFAYRNFSTFRIVNGLHIEAVAADRPLVIAGLLERAGETQRQNGWHGHTDITVRQAQAEILRPVLERYGFAPLAYGKSRMATHSIGGEALQQLAQRPAVNLIHRLRPEYRGDE